MNSFVSSKEGSAFLSQLSNHSIFKRTTSGLATFNEDSSDNNINKKFYNKIVSRNNHELFIATENTIRCCDINNGNSYKILDIPIIDFEIERLLLNQSGTLLAIFNTFNLIVCSLPSPGFINSNTDSKIIEANFFKIGSMYYKDTNVKILKFLWNPLSKYDSNLIILSSDNFIRSFDLTFSFETSQYELNLLNTGNQSSFGLNFEKNNFIVDPISISFGSNDFNNPSGCLTLYIFNQDGDIYSLYPFMPTFIAVPKKFVEILFNETALLLENTKNNDTKNLLIRQFKFVSSLYKQLDTAQLEINNNLQELVIIKPPLEFEKINLIIQGFYKLSPFPDILYNFEGTDLINVSCGENLDLLVVTWSNGGILLLLQNSKSIMRWENDESEISSYSNFDDDEEDETKYDPTLISLEYIELAQQKSSSFSNISLVPLKNSNYKFYININNLKLIQLEFSKWGKLLNEAILSNNTDLFLKITSAPLNSDLMLISGGNNDQNLDKFEGLTILIEDDKEFIIEFRSSKVNIIEKELNEKAEKNEKDKIKLKSVPSIDNSDSNKYSTDIKYESLLSGPFEELKQLLSLINHENLSKGTKSGADLKYQLSATDEKSLQVLNQISKNLVLKNIINYHKFGLSLLNRLSLQHEELTLQINKLNDLNKSGHDAQSRAKLSEAQEEKLNKLVSKQQELDKRISKLYDQLNESLQNYSKTRGKDIAISNAEKKWFEELNQISNHVSGHLNAKVASLTSQASYIKSFILSSGWAGDYLNKTENLKQNFNREYDWNTLIKKFKENGKLIDFVGETLDNELVDIEVMMRDMHL
ncbi:hypothetical protein PACTADRAFT_1505 [Pachysolen tannophilus NRRL Y-2460]|uniref:Uncharacterized protein n=1 Tax=Pachysolen tannophilus NRRL Y-2460 TaxID=669874 RepID=A0A1E4TYV4_PACTA|nr:hypothetical protein PACTADRAFT_1505 [Pachysolen tannophilus NRRL Y-2460]